MFLIYFVLLQFYFSLFLPTPMMLQFSCNLTCYFFNNLCSNLLLNFKFSTTLVSLFLNLGLNFIFIFYFQFVENDSIKTCFVMSFHPSCLVNLKLFSIVLCNWIQCNFPNSNPNSKEKNELLHMFNSLILHHFILSCIYDVLYNKDLGDWLGPLHGVPNSPWPSTMIQVG